MTNPFDLLKHFKPEEFDRPEKMNHKLLYRLDRVRALAGVPIYVTSSYRSGDERSHGDGEAVDISDNLKGKPVSSVWRFKVLSAALWVGFRRVGIYDRHIHLDVSTSLPGEVCWWGTSK